MNTVVTTLNVGGTLFTTTMDTLLKYDDTLFKKILGKDLWWSRIDDVPFIDRDPSIFSHILGFMRGYSSISADMETLRLIYEDSIYYRIGPLTDALRVKLCILTREEEVEYKRSSIDRIIALRTAYGDADADADGDVSVDTDIEEIESILETIEKRHEEEIVDMQSDMIISWFPEFVNMVCPRIERCFGMNLSSFTVNGGEYFSIVRDSVKKYLRGVYTVGPIWEFLFKFMTDCYTHTQIPRRTVF